MKTKIFLGFVFSILLASCAVTDFDETVNFNRYRTFDWGTSEMDVTNPLYENELISKNIMRTVEAELTKKGIQKDTVDPDIRISFQTFTEKEERTVGANYPAYSPFGFYRFGFGWGMPFGWGYPMGWYSPPRTEVVTEGTLIINVHEADTNELLWKGSVTGDVDNIKQLQRQIQKGVRAILKKYPTPLEDVSV